MIVSACAAPAVWLAEPVTTRRVAAAGLTVTESRSAPALEMLPSVAETTALSTLYSFIEPPVVDTPLVKVIAVEEPNAIAAAALLVTVGAVTGLLELLAPLKVRLWAPV